MAEPICPKCRRQRARRVARNGFLQTTLFARLGYFPWECSSCRTEFLYKQRGDRKKSTPATEESPVGGYTSD